MSSPFWKKLSTGGKPQRAGGGENLTDQKIAEKRREPALLRGFPSFCQWHGQASVLPAVKAAHFRVMEKQSRAPARAIKLHRYTVLLHPNRSAKKGDAAAGEGAACVCAGVEQAGNERDFAVARENRRNHAGHQQADPVHGAHNHGGQQYGQRGGRGHEPGQKQGREPENVGNGLFINDASHVVDQNGEQRQDHAGENGDAAAEMETLGDERGHPGSDSLPQHPLQQDAEQNDQQKS